MNEFIKLNNVSVKYGENYALKECNLTIEKGEFVAIIGQSGCGKTTLLRLLNGLTNQTDGEVFVNGQDLSNTDLIELRRNIGYVIQEIALFPHMNVEKNISYVPNLLPKRDKKAIKENAKKYLQLVELDEDMLERFPAELSGGQRQRVGIARGLMSNPQLLLMDEAFSAVDEITRKSLQEMMLKLYKELGLTVILVTHDIKEALSMATRVLVMKAGQIEQDGTPNEILENPKTQFVEELARDYRK
ncbi:MAG: ABC transporter ATP-binding protein [Clostridia bacterium]